MGKTVKLNLNSTSTEKISDKSSPMEHTMKSSPMEHTMKPTNTREQSCLHMGKQKCENGECVSNLSLCSEKNNINQGTMLIMVIVGLTIIIFLIILYCLQQRERNQTQSLSLESHTDQNSSAEGDNIDNLSLYQPPPPYEEVMSSSIYPNTHVIHQRMNSFTMNVPPPTPPPNYDAALNILAHSHESVSRKTGPITPVLQKTPSIRRCHSEEILSPHHLPDTISRFIFTQISQTNENR